MDLAQFWNNSGGYEIDQSLRFNSADSAYLSRTPASAGNRKTWTWSGWVKRSTDGRLGIWSAGITFGPGTPACAIYYNNSPSNNTLEWIIGGSADGQYITNARYRDYSSWYHIVIAYDSANGTASERFRIFVNGERATCSTQTMTQNFESDVNNTVRHTIGARSDDGSPGTFFNGYLAEINFIDGSALTPSSFGETDPDTGAWIPKRYSGSYGTNGFYLKFDPAATNGIGHDHSGNGNNWTASGFYTAEGTGSYLPYLTGAEDGSNPNAFDGITTTGAYRNSSGSLAFTPSSGIAYSTLEIKFGNGNNVTSKTGAQLQVNGSVVSTVPAYTGGGASITYSTSTPGTLNSVSVGPTVPGEYGVSLSYIKINGNFLIDNTVANNYNDVKSDTPTTNYATFNPVDPSAAPLSEGNLKVTGTGSSWSHRRSTFAMTSGKWYWENTVSFVNYTLSGVVKPEAAFNNHVGQDSYGWGFQTDNGKIYNNSSGTSYGSAVTTGTVLGFAFDADTGKMWVRNASGYYNSGDPVAGTNPAMTAGAGTYFAAGSGYQTTEQNTFNFGQTSFSYTPPTGYKALNTANLPEPTIKDGGKYFDTVLYTGNGGTQTLSSLNFSPDLVWIKGRSVGYNHQLTDSVRGTGKELQSDLTGSETSYGLVSALNSNGFTVFTNGTYLASNANGTTYAAWCWDANGAGSTNNSGSITSTVSANATAGFSIVTWTGTGADGSYGHGLGVQPAMIIHKRRDSTSDWHVWHKGLPTKSPTNDVIYLNLTNGQNGGNSNLFRLDPTSTLIYTGSAGSHNVNGATYVDYVFSEVAGYSKFGSYTGNGSSDGPFVFCGFRPKFLMTKMSSGISNWYIKDTTRDTYNAAIKTLYPDTSDAEGSDSTFGFDFLSNGFKVRSSLNGANQSGQTFIYAAFAEHPFKYANAR